MAVAEELQIIVDAKVSQAIRDMNRVDRSIAGTATTTNKLSDTFKKLAGPVAIGAVIVGLAKMGKELINAASDGEESADKFGVVFATVADDAEAAADRIKDEFKLSDETVQKFLSGVGDITTGLGATGDEALDAAESITKLGLDISSLSNIPAEQSVKALTSLFTGEREAAKALGIVINDTNLKAYAEDMGKVFKELTPLEKGFLSLELATKQSELAIGNFALTSGSYANTAKAAAEATKDLKAALGVSLLPTATAGVEIFTILASKIAEVVKEHNELQEIVGRFDEGNATAQDRVDIAQNEVVLLREQIGAHKRILENLNSEDAAAQIIIKDTQEIINELTDQLRLASSVASHYYQIAKAAKVLADAEKARVSELERVTKLELDASSLLDSRRKARLTDEEKLLENLNNQIDIWAQFREVAGVQELLNDLVRERNELLEEDTKTAEANTQAWLDNYNSKAEGEYAYLQAILDRTERQKEAEGEVVTELANTQIAWENLASVGLGAMTQGFTDIGEALVKGKLGIADFGKLFLNSISSILQGLGAELAALATVQLLLGNVPGSVAGYAQSAAAFLASGVVGGLAGSFAEGGSFTTQGPQLYMAGDNPGGAETVTVEPVSSKGANVDNSSGGSRPQNLTIDGQTFRGWLQSDLDNGLYRIPKRIIA